MYQKRNKELEIIALYTGDYKKRYYLREISKLSKLPLKTTQDTLKVLEKKRVLKSVIEGKNKYFALNLDNIQTKLCLLQAEVYKASVFLEKYPQFKTFFKETRTNIPLIVFGSFAKFKADKNSDVDLLIIAKKEPKLPTHLLPNKIQKIILTETSFAKALEIQEPLIKEIEDNHIILNKYSFYVNSMWGYYEKSR